MAKVGFYRGNKDYIDALPVADGQLVYNTETGETYEDVGFKRIPTGGGGGGYPQDNPAMTHNLPRGKKLGTNVTAEQYAAIADGSFKDLYVGDYWTIGGRDYVIAGINYYKNCGDTSTSKNHLVMVPRANLYDAQMHNTESGGYEPGEANTTVGGYVNSDMRTTNLEKAKTMINEAFPGHVLTKRLLLVNAVANGQASSSAWVDSTVDLMNEQMVYGCPVVQNMRHEGSGAYNYRIEKTQLPIFAHAPEMMNIRDSYWLQDVCSASSFVFVSYAGYAYDLLASRTLGVRPAFIIG